MVAVPSAFAVATVLAEDQRLSPAESTVMPAGRLELDDVLAMLIETAAATLIAPLDELAGGVAGADPPPLPPFAELTLLPNERWLARKKPSSPVPAIVTS